MNPDEVKVIKLQRTQDSRESKMAQIDKKDKKISLDLQGMNEKGEVIFKYINKDQNVDQSFGINIKKYLSEQPGYIPLNNYTGRTFDNFNIVSFMVTQDSEGPYKFLPKWDDPLPHQFGQISSNVDYQIGNFMEQWTVNFEDPKTEEYGVARVRFSELFREIIEVDIELGQIPISDGQGKDVITTFKFYDGFNPRGQFWTDSNSLEMQKRNLIKTPMPLSFINEKNQTNQHMISGNYFPVDSAIIMRDQNQTNLQVTVMNDRAQGGSADLTEKATIELMQNRRMMWDDQKGMEEPLNEQESIFDAEHGVHVNARYWVQIFDYKKGQSL